MNYFYSVDSPGKRLHDLMIKSGLNAQMLSERTGIAKSSISGYLNDSHVVGQYNATIIANVLNCSPEYLRCIDGINTVYSSINAPNCNIDNALIAFEIDALARRLNSDNMQRLKAYAELLVKAQDADKQNDN